MFGSDFKGLYKSFSMLYAWFKFIIAVSKTGLVKINKKESTNKYRTSQKYNYNFRNKKVNNKKIACK